MSYREKIARMIENGGIFSREEVLAYMEKINYKKVSKPDLEEIRICLWAERIINSI